MPVIIFIRFKLDISLSLDINQNVGKKNIIIYKISINVIIMVII